MSSVLGIDDDDDDDEEEEDDAEREGSNNTVPLLSFWPCAVAELTAAAAAVAGRSSDRT